MGGENADRATAQLRNACRISNLRVSALFIGMMALNDQARFWLCVVPLDSDEDIDELTPERVEDLARSVRDSCRFRRGPTV
jgi:diadenosine tetraphosphate (Ap4A) HIT family hydrolase